MNRSNYWKKTLSAKHPPWMLYISVLIQRQKNVKRNSMIMQINDHH